jgi:murein DD-endopeptidase MepM/ murein hydrolase activator NlpD
MRRALAVSLILACTACATTKPIRSEPRPNTTATAVVLPATVTQGALLFGNAPAGSRVVYDDKTVRVSANGRFVVGVSREQTGVVKLAISIPGGATQSLAVPIVDREFPLERINGVPEATVNPPPEIAARIEREQAEVSAARVRDDDRSDFDVKFIWPVTGRISGRFGSQRIYNGTPKSPHSGLDVAAAKGTAIQAPAAGVITFVNPDLYLTGGTVVVDHGHGVSSNFLHMSRIDVKVGERVEQGQVIGLVGATGRVTGPHMHWGMTWFGVRVDPQLLVDAAANPQKP